MARSKNIPVRPVKESDAELANLASFPKLNPFPVVEVDLAGQIHYLNPAAERLFPDLQERGSRHPLIADWESVVRTFREDRKQNFSREMMVGEQCFHQALYYVEENEHIRIYSIDVTERLQAQKEREITLEFLRLVNESKNARGLIQAVATFFQRQSGCQAVGVRLKEGDDYPYFEARGFPEEFILVENSLCTRESADGIPRDTTDNPLAECVCKNVIRGQFDPSKPFFTAHGSFWTNSTTELLATASEADRQAAPHNLCEGEEYESVALIPLHVGEERLGLLQLNDRRKGVFSPEVIGLWERLADHLAVALAKFRAEEELFKNQADLNYAQHVAQTGNWRLDMQRDKLYWSDETYRIFGVALGTPMTNETFLDLVHPEDREFLNRNWQAALGGKPYDIEHRTVVNGKVRWIRERAELEFDAQGRLLSGFGTAQDITDLKKKESELERLNRTLKALRDSSQAVSCAAEESDFVDAVCRIVVEDCGYKMVWVGYAEQDAEKSVRPVAWAGFEEGYLETLKLTWADTARGRGPTGTAIRRGRPIACRNMRTDPRLEPWREEAIRRGYASSLALPLLADGNAFGALTIYSGEADPFSNEEIRLLSELANDLAYGISAIRMRIAHTLAEEAQRQSEERYRRLVELSPDAVFVHRDDRVEYVNPAALQLFGATSAEQILGKAPLELVHPDYWEIVRQRIEKIREGSFPERIEEKIVRLDGEFRDVEVASSLFTDRQGSAIQVILHDITARKLAEEQLRLHLTILESTANAIVIVGRNGLIQWVNPAFTQLTGYSAAEVRGRNPRLLKSDRQDPVFYKSLWDTILAGRVWHGELINKRKDGTHYAEEMTITPVADAQGCITHFIAVKQDVTERKQMEEKLLAAKEAAEAANVAKGHFLANISHELRTPMNAILGMTELALGEELTPSLSDYLTTAKESADLLLELLNEILDFSRLDAGQFNLEPAPFSLRRMLTHTLKTLGVRAYEKGLELVCDLSDQIPDQLLGDSLRLRQVLNNLLGNAIKFTPRGEIVVSVIEEKIAAASLADDSLADDSLAATRRGARANTVNDSESDVLLKFTVEDSGVGIAPQDQERIFTPFTQADSSMTRHYGGSGLGLTIASGLVKLMGGRIWVESRPGQGSSFFFTVRLKRRPPSTNGMTAVLAKRDQLQGLSILLVAENPTVRRVLQLMLFRWGMKPETVADVPAALVAIQEAAASGQTFSLALVDAALPGTDGYSLADWIKNNPGLVGTTVLMFSPCERVAHVRRCQELGVRYLEKPISQSNLLNLLSQVLGLPDMPLPAATETLETIKPLTLARPLRILVVEDNLANQKLAVHILRKFGQNAEIAGDGREAVERMLQEDFDLVLMDIQMPVMDGFQATAALRAMKDPAKACVPIVAMTAHAMKGDQNRCLAAGMDGYLDKPIDTAKLMAILKRLAKNPKTVCLPQGREEVVLPSKVSDYVFDPREALARCFDREMFDQMRDYFFTQSAETLEQIRGALSRGAGEEIATAAHALRGTVVYLGSRSSLEAVECVERIGRNGDLTSATEAIERLATQVELLKQALASHEQSNSGLST